MYEKWNNLHPVIKNTLLIGFGIGVGLHITRTERHVARRDMVIADRVYEAGTLRLEYTNWVLEQFDKPDDSFSWEEFMKKNEEKLAFINMIENR